MFRIPELLILTDLVRRLKKTEGALPAFQEKIVSILDDGVLVAAGERGPEVVFADGDAFKSWCEFDHPFGVHPPRRPRFVRMKAVRYANHQDVPQDRFVLTAASVDPTTSRLNEREWSGYSHVEGVFEPFVLEGDRLRSVDSDEGHCNLFQKEIKVGEYFSCRLSEDDNDPYEYRITHVEPID